VYLNSYTVNIVQPLLSIFITITENNVHRYAVNSVAMLALSVNGIVNLLSIFAHTVATLFSSGNNDVVVLSINVTGTTALIT